MGLRGGKKITLMKGGFVGYDARGESQGVGLSKTAARRVGLVADLGKKKGGTHRKKITGCFPEKRAPGGEGC